MTRERTLRILTLNIAHGRGLSQYQGFLPERGILRNLSRITKLLERVSPDLVAFQEVVPLESSYPIIGTPAAALRLSALFYSLDVGIRLI